LAYRLPILEPLKSLTEAFSGLFPCPRVCWRPLARLQVRNARNGLTAKRGHGIARPLGDEWAKRWERLNSAQRLPRRRAYADPSESWASSPPYLWLSIGRSVDARTPPLRRPSATEA